MTAIFIAVEIAVVSLIAGKKDVLLVGVFLGLFFYLTCGLVCLMACLPFGREFFGEMLPLPGNERGIREYKKYEVQMNTRTWLLFLGMILRMWGWHRIGKDLLFAVFESMLFFSKEM